MAFMWARGGDLIQYDCTSFVHLQQCGQHLVQPCCSWTCCDRPSNWCFSLPRCPMLHTVRAAGVIETGVTLCKEARQQSIRHLRLGGRSRATRQPRHICMHCQLPPLWDQMKDDFARTICMHHWQLGSDRHANKNPRKLGMKDNETWLSRLPVIAYSIALAGALRPQLQYSFQSSLVPYCLLFRTPFFSERWIPRLLTLRISILAN
jgi:hypothetical protein